MRAIQPYAWVVPLLAFGLLINQPSQALCCPVDELVEPEAAKYASCQLDATIRAVETSQSDSHPCSCRNQEPNSPLIQPGTRTKFERTPTPSLVPPALAIFSLSQSSVTPLIAGTFETSGPPIFLRLARFRN